MCSFAFLTWEDLPQWLVYVMTGPQRRPGMTMKAQPRYSKKELARRGDEIYERGGSWDPGDGQ
jgi:hypothetical protein